MKFTQTAHRVSFIRKVGWLSVASMLALALLAPATNAHGHSDGQSWGSVTQDCTGGPHGDIAPVDGMIAWVFVHTKVDGHGTLTAYFQNAGKKTTSSYVEGGIKYIIWTSSPDTLKSFSDNLKDEEHHDRLVLSHVCVGQTTTTTSTSTHSTTSDDETTSTTSDDETTSTSTAETTTDVTSTAETTTDVTSTAETTTDVTSTAETTTDVTSTTSDQAISTVEATSSEAAVTTETTATPSFTLDVAGVTDAPSVTLPPTDTMSGPAAPSSDSWRLLLIVGAALLASVLVLTPAAASRRR